MAQQTALDYYIENQNAKPILKYREVVKKAQEIEQEQITQAFERGMAFGLLKAKGAFEGLDFNMNGEKYFRITHEE
jgi:hypothetical protein